MSKHIENLNIPEENKILLSKIDKKIIFLNRKTDEFFDGSLVVDSERIEDAYAINEDLISILNKNEDLVTKLKEESLSIRKSHQTDFTREIDLSITNKVNEYSLIKTTIEKKDNLINLEEKLYALSRKKNFIRNRTNRRKLEMDTAFLELEKKLNNEKTLYIDSMEEDIFLIKKFIDPKLINRSRLLLLTFIIPLITIIILFGGVLIWIL